MDFVPVLLLSFVTTPYNYDYYIYLKQQRGHWGDQGVDGRIILRWIFRKLEGVVETGWSWLRIGTGVGH
jgi:hypothetical protein